MPEIVLPHPHPGQQTVQAEAARFNWLTAGRRWRKTTMFMTLAVEGALKGIPVFWGAPVYDTLRIGWDEMRRAAAGVADFNQGKMTVKIPGAAPILFRSLDDPDNARGHTAGLILVDEAPEVKPWAWHEVLRPMLLDTQGDAWLGGTPKGLNWFYDQWTMAHDGRAADSRAWQAPSLGVRITEAGLVRDEHPLENPEIPFTEMVDAFNTTPLTKFRQEYLASFEADTEAVFQSADVDAMERGWLGLREPMRDARYMTVWDIGRRRDATWGITVDHSSTPYQVVASERVMGVPFPEIQAMIDRRIRAYPGRHFVEFNNQGDPVIENLMEHAEPWVTTAKSKHNAVTALQLLIEGGHLKQGIPQLTHELKGYRWQDKPLVQDGVMVLAILAAELPVPSRNQGTDLGDDPELRQRGSGRVSLRYAREPSIASVEF